MNILKQKKNMIASRSSLGRANVRQVPGRASGHTRPIFRHAPSLLCQQHGLHHVKLPLLIARAAGSESSESTPLTPVAAPDATPSEPVEQPAPEPETEKPEQVFFEGDLGSPAELAISLALAATLIYIPLSMASLGRRLWTNYKITDKRLIITNTSPLFARQMQVAFKSIREVRAAPRAFGLWGDMVIFLKNGDRLELVGVQKFTDIKQHIERCMWTL